MGHPARHEIEKHAKDEFAVAQERIAVKHAEKRRRMVAEVALRNNIGGYAPALTELAAKHVRQTVIALADAYVRTFNFFEVPCDVEAERSLEAGAQQIAAGAISGVRGELDLIQRRIRRHLPNTGGVHGEIGRSMQSAINAGKLRLKRQRITFRGSQSPAQRVDGNSTPQSVEEVRPANAVHDSSSQIGHSAVPDETAQPPNPISRRPLKAIREDQGRRVEAKKDLEQALHSYAQTIPRQRDLDLNRLAEIWGQYAAALYDSLAESYRDLRFDAEALFGEAGVLAGGQTVAEVKKDMDHVRILRPDHWPDPQLSRSSHDSPELLRELRALLVGDDLSFASLYEEQWFWSQIKDAVAGRIRKWKDAFAKLDATQAPEPASGDIVFLRGTEEATADEGAGFSGQHKALFKELLATGLELHALNHHSENLDFGPWSLSCDRGDADSAARLISRFRAAARKAANAAGAPHRVNLLDWWISKLARGRRLPYIEDLIRRSAEYCEELESNASELKPLVQDNSAAPGLRRDRYPADRVRVPYWLYDQPHRVLPDAGEEFAYWDTRIWQGFDRNIEGAVHGHRKKRRWVDGDGNPHCEAKDETRQRLKQQIEFRTSLLDLSILGLSYDLAVLQANYIIDRGLRGQASGRAFEDESAAVLERVQLASRKYSKRLGLSWPKQKARQVDLARPFREVGADLRAFGELAAKSGSQSNSPKDSGREEHLEALNSRKQSPKGSKPDSQNYANRAKRKLDPSLQQLKLRVKKLWREGLSHQAICDRLGDAARPPRAGWRDLTWPVAHKRHTAAVAKWLSEACR